MTSLEIKRENYGEKNGNFAYYIRASEITTNRHIGGSDIIIAGSTMYIERLLVINPSDRRRGIGRSLLNASIDLAKKEGVKNIVYHLVPEIEIGMETLLLSGGFSINDENIATLTLDTNCE